MIYIFEDRTERKSLHQDKINKYPDRICFATFDIVENQSLTDYISSNLTDADCIILHKSYTFPNKVDPLKILNEFNKISSIKTVLFSGGNENGVISSNGNHCLVNADIMYDNLSLFLEHYISTNEISFERLIWGSNSQLSKKISLKYDIWTMSINDDMDRPFIYRDLSLPFDKEDIDIICDSLDPKIKGSVKNIVERHKSSITGFKFISIIYSVINSSNY